MRISFRITAWKYCLPRCSIHECNCNVQYLQKISILSWGWVFSTCKTKTFKECMKLNWDFQRDGEQQGLRKKTFCGEGMNLEL